jgi:hypothetical protein
MHVIAIQHSPHTESINYLVIFRLNMFIPLEQSKLFLFQSRNSTVASVLKIHGATFLSDWWLFRKFRSTTNTPLCTRDVICPLPLHSTEARDGYARVFPTSDSSAG